MAADGRALTRALRVAGHIEPVFVADIAGLADAALAQAIDGDVLLCMGAGSIGSFAASLAGKGDAA